MYEISSEIEISANPEKVWSILTNISEWENWNPIVKNISGDFSLGSNLDIQMVGKNGADGPRYKPQLTAVETNKKFRWSATMMAGFLMTNDKEIELIPTNRGTKVIHKELFKGLMFKMMCSQMDKGVPPMLESMNQALKKQAENES